VTNCRNRDARPVSVPGPVAVPVVFGVNVLVLAVAVGGVAVPELAVVAADVWEPECGLPGGMEPVRVLGCPIETVLAEKLAAG
jgi:hypothetical protein